nr:beta-lactamase family protein [Arenimonas sp.]
APVSAGTPPDLAMATEAGATFLAPRGWALKSTNGLHAFTAPEGNATLAIAHGPAHSADDAVQNAWTRLQGNAPAAETAADRPLRSGWTTVRAYRYPAKPGSDSFRYAQAVHDGREWVVVLADLSGTVAARRESQFTLLLGSLRAKGYAGPTPLLRKANTLDAARVATLVDFLEQARVAFDIPGAALGLVQDGEVRFAGGLGVRKLGSAEPVDASTRFLSASITKPLTSLMFAKRVDAGGLRWDQRVAEMSPRFRVADPVRTREIQVRHVLCACTGLPRQDFESYFRGDDLTPAGTLDLLATMAPTAGIGELYQYSNPMAVAGSYAIARQAYPTLAYGDAYDRAMQALVFDPLGMQSTTFDAAAAQRKNFASPHAQRVDGSTAVVTEAGFNDAGIPMRPDGGAWTNVTDLLAYLRMELAKGALPDGSRYIGEAALLERQVGQVARGGMDQWYGMGLKINENQGLRVVTHGGSMTGYQGEFAFLPAHGVGMVLLMNADAGAEVRGFFQDRLLEVLFDLDLGVQARMAERASARAKESREDAGRLKAPLDANLQRRLAGRYRHPALGEIQVIADKGSTWLDTGGWRSELAAPTQASAATVVETITPGGAGLVLEAGERDGLRTLRVSDGEREYELVETGG